MSVECYFNQNVATFKERAEERLFTAVGKIVCEVPAAYLNEIKIATLRRSIYAGDSLSVCEVLFQLKDQTPNNLLPELERALQGWLDIVADY